MTKVEVMEKRKRMEAEWHNANWETRERWIMQLERWMREDRFSQVIEELERSKI
jgi:hypothetical protein